MDEYLLYIFYLIYKYKEQFPSFLNNNKKRLNEKNLILKA